MKAGAVTNAAPNKVKVFKAHVVRANRIPLASEQDIPESEINPLGQASKIYGPQYKYREGVYYADTAMNYLRFGTPINETAKKYGLVNGDQLRGHACNTVVSFDGNALVILYFTKLVYELNIVWAR